MTDILDLIGGKLTDEQVNSLLDILNSEGKNVEINSDGTFETKIGHTYVVESSTDEVLITNENDSPLCELIPAGQVGFVANTTISKTSSLNCTITEVFKFASLIQMGGGGISNTVIGLPNGFLKVEFLQSNYAYTTTVGNNVPNIQFKMPISNNTIIRTKCSYLDSSANCTVFGENSTSNRVSLVLNWAWSQRGNKYLWGNINSSTHFNIGTTTVSIPSIIESHPDGFYVNGAKKLDRNKTVTELVEDDFYLFRFAEGGGGKTRIFYFNAVTNGELQKDFIPALTLNGEPCMFDRVSKNHFLNAGPGKFIVGMSNKQALFLSKLNTLGGAITISLPSDYSLDEKVINSLEVAQSNGWLLTIQTHDPTSTSTASTFGMQRIWVRKTQDEYGNYTDENNNRWQVEWCVTMYTPDNSTPDQHGYEQFRSVEAACEYWGLTPYIDPTLEEEINYSQI